MAKPKTQAERLQSLHPRVGIGNATPVWRKSRRIVYGPMLDGDYIGDPRCRTFEGALRKAEKLSAEIRAAETDANGAG